MVEDNPALRQMLDWEFRELGYEVTAVENCRQARHAISHQGFDAVLLDYHLPDGNGLELLRLIKQSHPELPVIMCSAMNDRELEQNAKRFGARHFLAKPTPIQMLHSLFKQALNQGSQ